jgi:hypothetical protein
MVVGVVTVGGFTTTTDGEEEGGAMFHVIVLEPGDGVQVMVDVGAVMVAHEVNGVLSLDTTLRTSVLVI